MPDSTGRPTPFVLSPAEFVTLREQAMSFEHVEAMTPTEMAMTIGTTPETVRVGSASAGFLQLFGLDPTIGRGYSEGEDRARAPVIVLDGGLWQRRFGSDPGIVGQSITLDGVSYQVVGVTRAGYRPLLQSVDAWVPLGARIDPARMGRNMLGAARLRSGARIQLENGSPDLNDNLYTHFRHLTPGYFDVLRVRVLEGRPFDKRDRMGAAPVAVVSKAFADRMWPGRTPLGQRLRRTSPNARWLTVVGVVDDVMDSGLGLPLGPTLYVPYLQQNTNTARVTLVVRVQGNPESHIASVRDAIWSVDPLQPIDQPQSITGVLNASIAQPRFRTFVLSAFGVCGLVLACVDAYGVAAFAAVRRRREIGIRVALGADPSAVVRLVVQDAIIPAAIGSAAGALLAVVAARVLTSVLAHGESLDLSMAALCSGILLICAAAASRLPARRSAYGAPVDALRMG